LVVALSLVLKVIIAGLHVPLAVAGVGSADGTPGVAAQSANFAQFIICTPTGIKTFTLDENGDPTEVPTTPHVLADCGVCSVLQTGVVALTPVADIYRLEQSPPAAVSSTHDVLCPPSAPRLARGYDPPRV